LSGLANAFVVPGKSSRAYLLRLGASDEGHLHGANAVDNCFFATQAEKIRSRESEFRSQLKLPRGLFFLPGRLVPDKGILICSMPMPNWRRTAARRGLGVCRRWRFQTGTGATGERIRPGTVCFPGFAQREDLAVSMRSRKHWFCRRTATPGVWW